jgi:hypothetical protein
MLMSRVLIVALLIGLLGCGSGNPQRAGASVKGLVRYKGKPVTGGTIRLFGKENSGRSFAEGPINGDGTFRVANAPLGSVKVVVDTSAARFDVRPMIEKARAQGAPIDESKLNLPQGPPIKYMEIEGQYSDPRKTTVEITIVEGENQRDIDLP